MSAPSPTLVREALEPIYGSGSMVTALASHIVDKWDDWNDDPSRDLITHLHLCIWNWFPGGSTAEVAANKIMEALD